MPVLSLGATVKLDCLTCGACCCNPDENRAEGYVDYVEVAEGEPLLRKPHLRARYLARNAEGQWHLRLDREQRCVALQGALGKHVWCSVYQERPRGCRRVTEGSPRCLQYRRERGIDEKRG